MMPLLALALLPARQLGMGLGAGAVVMIGAAVGALLVPVFSADRPQHLNVLHIEDRSVDEAYWALQGDIQAADDGPSVPAALMTAAPFDDVLIPYLPWSDDRILLAPASATDAPAPSVDILDDEVVDGARRVRLRLHSPRGSDRMSLYVPERGELRRIDIAGFDRPIEQFPIEKGYQGFHCFGLACDGLELTLHLGENSSPTLLVVDSSPHLPPDGAGILAARPEMAQPRHDGDRSLVFDWIALDAA
jgi:hypothetical protein